MIKQSLEMRGISDLEDESLLLSFNITCNLYIVILKASVRAALLLLVGLLLSSVYKAYILF